MPDLPMTVYVTNLDTGERVERPLQDHEYPSQITVFCDRCGTKVTRDHVVSELISTSERLEVARASLRRENWQCTQSADVCPECKAAVL